MRRTTGDSDVDRHARERGAILPMAAAGIVLAVVAAALSIDLGALALKRRDLQKLADIAAMDTSYVLDEIVTADDWPISVGQLAPPSQLAMDRATESLGRNGFDADDAEKLVVELGEYNRDDEPEFAPCHDVLTLLAVCEANAVRVVLADEAPKYFDMSSGPGRITEVDSIAMMRTIAGGDDTDTGELTAFSAGSFAARVEGNTGSAPLPLILGNLVRANPADISTDLVSYQGIAATTLTLEGLAAEMAGGDVDGLFFSDITFRQLLEGSIAVLDRESENTADFEYRARLIDAVTGMRRIRDALDTAADSGVTPPDSIDSQTFRLADVIQVPGVDANAGTGGTVGDGAAGADFSTLDVVMGAAMVANGDHAVTFDMGTDFSPADLPEETRPAVEQGIADATISVRLIEAAQSPSGAVATEGTSVSTAQLQVELDVTLVDELSITQSLTEVLTTPTGVIRGTVVDQVAGSAIAGATVTLEGTQACAVTNPDGSYTIGGLVPGTYEVSVQATDRPPGEGTSVVVGGSTSSLNVQLAAPGGAATGNLPDQGCQQLGAVTGTVRNALGAAVPDAVVTIEQATSAACATTDVFGQYTVSGLVPGQYPLKARATALQERTGTAEVVAGAVTTADVTLDQVGTTVVAGCEFLNTLTDNVVATSGIHIPLVLEGVKSTATVADIDCAAGSVLMNVSSQIAAAGIGDITGLPSGGSLGDLPAADVLLNETLQGAVGGATGDLPSVAEDGLFTGPFPQETQTFGLSPTELMEALPDETEPARDLGTTIREAAVVDLSPLADQLGLLPVDLTRNQDRLNNIISTRMDPIVALVDWVTGGFGVTLLGTDVTVSDLDCSDVVEVTPPSSTRIPILVE